MLIAVIGPERLPETVRFLMHWFRRIRGQVSGVRTDILREMELEDMKKIHREFTDAKRGAETAFRSAVRGVSEEAGKIQAEVMEGNKPSDFRRALESFTEKSQPTEQLTDKVDSESGNKSTGTKGAAEEKPSPSATSN